SPPRRRAHRRALADDGQPGDAEPTATAFHLYLDGEHRSLADDGAELATATPSTLDLHRHHVEAGERGAEDGHHGLDGHRPPALPRRPLSSRPASKARTD